MHTWRSLVLLVVFGTQGDSRLVPLVLACGRKHHHPQIAGCSSRKIQFLSLLLIKYSFGLIIRNGIQRCEENRKSYPHPERLYPAVLQGRDFGRPTQPMLDYRCSSLLTDQEGCSSHVSHFLPHLLWGPLALLASPKEGRKMEDTPGGWERTR